MDNRTLRRICVAAWALFSAWALAIFLISSLSGSNAEHLLLKIPNWDKFCHMLAFAAGAVLLSQALRLTTDLAPFKRTLLTIALISFFGLSDEWHQVYVPGRSGADVWDWLSDTVGATFGALATYAGYRKALAQTSRPAPPGD